MNGFEPIDVSEDASYIEWKNWGAEFARLDPDRRAYFAKELAAARMLSVPQKVLEIGFGSGQFLRFCLDQKMAVTGIEINDLLVAEARKSGFDARAADELLNLPARSFDLIAAFDVIEHIKRDDIPEFLTAIGHALTDDGRIILRFPNGDSWLGMVNQNGDPTHQTQMGYFMLDYFARETGLQILSFRGPKSAGFAAGFIKGLHSLLARPIAKMIAGFLHLIYLPASPVVLSSSNVVAVLGKSNGAVASR